MARRFWTTATTVIVSGILATASAFASVASVGIGAFGAGSTLTTFTGQVPNAEVNGLVVDGITFQYSLGNGQVLLDGGPGITNNITPLNIVSVGANSGTLTMLLPSPVNTFGYGFAVLSTLTLSSATTISLFDGSNPVGSLAFGGAPDPTFTGGFAGIWSTVLFDRVDVAFDSVGATAFALDNIRMTTVPEPGSLALLAVAFVGLAASRLRKQ